MAELVGFAEAFAAALAEVAPVLDERSRRLLMGAGARQLGRGGIKLIAAATGRRRTRSGRVPGSWRWGSWSTGGSARRVRDANRSSITTRGHRRRHRDVRGRVDPPLVDHHRAPRLPGAGRLLITADGGGSTGSRLRLWKTQLAELAAETGLQITVCHLPPGTSKWNKIEHRMFSAITLNWRGRPLQTHEVVVETIAATTTKTGLSIQSVLDTTTYERGIKITDKEMKAFEATHLHRHEFHGDWNYTVCAAPDEDATRPNEPK